MSHPARGAGAAGDRRQGDRRAAAVGAGVDLDTSVAALGIDLPAAAGDQLRAYLALLVKWNRVYNLTAVREPERMVTHHLLDSLAVLPHLAGGPGTRMLDIGTGAGLPGIPLAIARPEWALTLVDSNQKKASFVQQAIGELGLRNAVAQAIRAEALPAGAGFDLIVSRAFAELAAFVVVARPLLAIGGRIVAMKGQWPQAEIDALPAGVQVVAAPSLLVPGLPAQRHLVIIEATEPRP